MSRITRQSLGLVLGLSALFPASCTVSVCDSQPDAPSCRPLTLVGPARFSLTDTRPMQFTVERLNTSAQPDFTVVLGTQRIPVPGAKSEVPGPGQLNVTLDSAVMSTMPIGQVNFELTVGGYWHAATTAVTRLFVPPSMAVAATYTYPDVTTSFPVAIESAQLLTDSHPAIFVTEANGMVHQLSRYDLQGSALALEPVFSKQVTQEATSALITLNQGTMDSILVYSSTAYSIALIALPSGMRTLVASSMPAMAPAKRMRGIPGTNQFFLVDSATGIQSFAFSEGNFQNDSPATQAGKVPPLALFTTRAPSIPRQLDLDKARSFDAVVIDNKNVVTLVRYGKSLSPDDNVLTASATQVLADALQGTPAAAVALADIDNDGLQDLIIAQSGTGSILWAAQREDKKFEPALPMTDPLTGVRDLAVGDFDGNRYQDLAVITSNSLVVYRNSGRN